MEDILKPPKKILSGPTNRLLDIDLTGRTWSVYALMHEELKKYLGGKGLCIKFLYDRLKPGIDPLSPENIIAVMPGVLTGTGISCSGRFHAATKSPLTGIIMSSSCGGPFGLQLRAAGWDGLLVTGKSDTPVYLEITEDGVEFKDAGHLWGMGALSVQNEIGQKKCGILSIGPAGENGVRFANAASGHRFLGRAGMGAVMGSKNLKAMKASGTYTVTPKEPEKFEKIKKKALSYINANPSTSISYRNYGTPANTNLSNSANILPVMNFKDGSHEKAYEISGEAMKEKHRSKHSTCRYCTILCGKKGSFNGRMLSVPEFETVGLLGSNLGIFDSDEIAEWNHICGEAGMDTISAGGVLAWVMEAQEKGIYSSKLRFGRLEGVAEALEAIAGMEGQGREMGMGTRYLSEKYGGKDFAIQVKGLEMAAYDPRGAFGQGLAYAVANRGACHLSAYLVALEVYFNLLSPYSTRAKAEFTRFFEDLNCCINSLQTCIFTCFAYLFEVPLTKMTPRPVLGFLMQNFPKIAVHAVDFGLYARMWSAVTGIPISNREFLRAGERIHVMERLMNTKEGISAKDDTLPLRILEQGRESDPERKTVPLAEMQKKYYRIRGYDENGIPGKPLLKKLMIDPR